MRPDLVTPDGSHVLNSAGYHVAVVNGLIARGFCAFFDGEEIAAKRENAFSEQWDIESAGGRSIRLYTATCRPAWDAIPPAGSPVPSPTPGPTPSPSPAPCVSQPARVDCSAGCALFWQDALARYGHTEARTECHWFPVLGNSLLIGNDSPPMGTMTPCKPDYRCCEWVPTPQDIGKAPRAIDRECNVLQMPGRNIVHRPEDGYLGDLGCVVTPAVTCPSPSPPPPPTGDQCPWLECIGTHVQSVVCNGQSVPLSQLRAGCNVNLDATANFGGCGPNYRCDAECDLPTSKNACCNGLKQLCESPDGPEWVQLSGPQTRCRQGPRGWGCGLDSVRSGTYKFMPCGNGWIDRRGIPNRNQGPACNGTDPRTFVTFVVP